MSTHCTELFQHDDSSSRWIDEHLIIVACGLKTPENLAHVMRLAANLGCTRIAITNFFNHQLNLTKVKRMARMADPFVTLTELDAKNLKHFIPKKFTWVALETAKGSASLFQVSLPAHMALFIGNEQSGIPPEFIENCNKVIHIPMHGVVKSMNVSHAASVALFEWLRQNPVPFKTLD
jgi:tRNA G18 (ribose-2'-O)-methylase SpoU